MAKGSTYNLLTDPNNLDEIITVIDKSDTTFGATGTNKRLTLAKIQEFVQTNLNSFVYNPKFTISNSSTAVNQLVPTGDPANTSTVGYNLLTSFLESNEDVKSNISIQYKNTSNANQNTVLDETNNKFLFPSNLNTFGVSYVPCVFRITGTIDWASTNNATTKFYIRLRRVVDNSIIYTSEFKQSDFGAETNDFFSAVIPSFVNSETDPFVVDGCYFDILNNSNSTGSVTLQDLSIRIFFN